MLNLPPSVKKYTSNSNRSAATSDMRPIYAALTADFAHLTKKSRSTTSAAKSPSAMTPLRNAWEDSASFLAFTSETGQIIDTTDGNRINQSQAVGASQRKGLLSVRQCASKLGRMADRNIEATRGGSLVDRHRSMASNTPRIRHATPQQAPALITHQAR